MSMCSTAVCCRTTKRCSAKSFRSCSCAAMGTRTISHRCSMIFCCWWNVSSMNRKNIGNIQEQVECVVAYFNENYNSKISIDDYAESLHISTNWFIHNFKQYAGMSPAQYILSLRMVNAQSLLERTTYNIKEISEIVGYENPLYFSRVFKKEIGKSPAQYRKEMIPIEAV